MKFLLIQIKQVSRGNIIDGACDDYELWLRLRQPIKPEDQLDLTEAELAEDVMKVLETENTSYQKNLVIYSFKDGGFVPVNNRVLLLIAIRFIIMTEH